MCTLILLRNAVPRYPLVVAANRDEQLDRPAVPPRIINKQPAIYAPLDLQAMGTWIGVSERGVFVGITNRDDVKTEPGRLSRGGLVVRALLAADAKQAMTRIMKIDAKQYNGFQLLIANHRSAYIVRGDGERTELVTTSKERVIVLTAAGTMPDQSWRVKNILAHVRLRDAHHGSTPRSLDRLLSLHDFKDVLGAGVCVHGPDGKYGTRSSTIVRMDKKGSAFQVWHREGSACSGHFGEPFTLPIVC